ncbi:putative regulatory protein, FmdB family [Desulfonatronum thiosulfatophilum]|uniref:Putative regulatory protein, FmdB family n=1 Tax=Desulfonatronum thiosulfatophilum TaxID=617002 RepID=A0A1G6AMY9_9BACT|nr:zinc ribbon domain-containing protein [Desulfonatronum thiosulfatophilum]SDB09758.1 putative regulatory protein, FmdB family [Desulfonatronum thiosulfatophilum]
MPIFEYSCPDCNLVFEDLTRASDQGDKTCPQCRSDRAAKILSVCSKPATAGSSAGSFAGHSAPASGCSSGRGFS